MNNSRRHNVSLLAGVACLLLAAPALALPALQLYIPDAVYDTSLESWVIDTDTFELWVVGDVGAKGTIYNVDLVASVYGSSGSVTITPSIPIDPSPELDRPGYNGIVGHEEFENADGHIFWTLGDMTDATTPIENYSPDGAGDSSSGTIFKYMVHVTGYDAVHFDAFDHYFTGAGQGSRAAMKPHYVFAPFSHDASGGGEEPPPPPPPPIPEPGTMALLGTGLAAALGYRKRK